MNNIKKGFTLVELLGVIVVLAILALITIPVISNVINDVRIKALQSSAYGLVEAGNLYYAQYGGNSNIRFDIDNNLVSSTDTDNLLKYKGSVKSGVVILDKIGNVTVCITDGKNAAYKNYNETQVTTKKGQTCSIDTNSYIVKLSEEGDTLTELSGEQLTSEIQDLKDEIASLATKDELNSLNNNLSNQIIDVRNSQISLNDVYPVGSIYITVTEDTVAKVQAKFGGTWVAFGSGRTLVGVNTSDSDFNIVEKEAGEKTHTLTVNEMPSHNHRVEDKSGRSFAVIYENATGGVEFFFPGNGGACSNCNVLQTANVGGNGAHNNLQPYITVYMYKRTA